MSKNIRGAHAMGMKLGYLLITLELEQMSKYLDMVQTSLEQHFEKLEASYQESMAREITEDEATILDDHYTDDFIEAARDFPQLLLVSFVVTWYSFVEQQLIDLCERLELSISVKPKDSESFSKGIRRARKFLLEAGNYKIEANHWQELINVGRLRNTLVHEGKRLHGSYSMPDGECVPYTTDNGLTVYIPIEDSLYRYLQKHDMIQSSGLFFYILPSFDYCRYLVVFGKQLFSKLYADLRPSW
jgi:hypothetical protein